ncbi:MAG: hypothetical protein QOK40_721 [Miltoncostaeaceae bacterium]|nr:hypothetical protein [Miltoncostaeaceae bacterium]
MAIRGPLLHLQNGHDELLDEGSRGLLEPHLLDHEGCRLLGHRAPSVRLALTTVSATLPVPS